jgi:hypothetical protein
MRDLDFYVWKQFAFQPVDPLFRFEFISERAIFFSLAGKSFWMPENTISDFIKI